MSRVSQLIDAPEKRLREAERLIEKQAQTIDRLRASKIKTPTGSKPRKSGKSYLQVFCGDSHGAYVDADALSAFIGDLKVLQPREIFHVGDILEASTFLAQHHVIGTVAQSEYTFEDDCLAANFFLDAVQNAAPKADITLIEGNHDARIEKACVTWSLQKKIDAKFLLSMFSPETVLNLKPRGIDFVKRTDYRDGLSVSGTKKIEFNTLVQHGEAFAGPNATRQLMQKLGTNVIHGHNHRLDVVYGETANGVIGGWGTGCLAQRRPLWNLTKPTDWVHGYLVRVVRPGRGFLCFPVPIINGVSYLGDIRGLL